MDHQVLKLKIVFIGDQSVGKSSVINRFIFDNFSGNQQPTVGVDFVSKTVQVENKSLRIQLWDTAGQERFHSLVPAYIKDSAAAIIVYDITSNQSVMADRSSYENIEKWLEQVRDVRGDDAGVYIFANKTDLGEERAVSLSEAKEKMSQIGLEVYEGSAKTGDGIKDFFKMMTYNLAGNIDKKETPGAGDRKKEATSAPPRGEAITLNSKKSEEKKQQKSCSC